MPIKILTHHNLGTPDTHWFNASAYNQAIIEAVEKVDATGGNLHRAPTSIPSPFAQMDLALNAFKKAVRVRNLTQISVLDFKLISDTLDVGEVMFNADRFKDTSPKVIITSWDRTVDLANLRKSTNFKHKRLAEVLELYLNQDAAAYNFDAFDKIYLLKYGVDVIGGTSPATLFFTSGNDLGSIVNIKMTTGSKMFDKEYKHLYERSREFQLMLYGLRASYETVNGNNLFKSKFNAVSEYMDISLAELRRVNKVLGEQIAELTPTSYQDNVDFEDLTETANTANVATVLRSLFPLKKWKIGGNGGGGGPMSDFMISPTKHVVKQPLVLQKGHAGFDRLGRDLIYWGGAYNQIKPEVPHFDARALINRELPSLTGIQYPYLVVSDFLEPYLIRLPYPINKDKFFNGNVPTENRKIEKDYILPIKKAFFDYFNPSDLANMLKMEVRPNTNGVSVKLTIPIQKGNKIVLERLYIETDMTNIALPNLYQNEGFIIEHRIGATLYPCVKTPTGATAEYRLMFLDADTSTSDKFELDFYNNVGAKIALEDNMPHKRTDKTAFHATNTLFYIIKENFDYIHISKKDSSGSIVGQGILMPKFNAASSANAQFSFAVDFGTTNTHIEYVSNTQTDPQSFDIGLSDLQVGTLHDPTFIQRDPNINKTGATSLFDFPLEFLPEKIGGNSLYGFPQRSVVVNTTSFLNNATIQDTYSLADFNIPFVYEKQALLPDAEKTLNLKWVRTTDAVDQRKVEAFLEQLVLMMRAKVLLNQGDLAATDLIVFYPSSMDDRRRRNYERIWRTLFSRFINITKPVLVLPESFAPFYYYKAKNLISTIQPAVSIDIGGGTTDVVIFESRENENGQEIDTPILHTSFRFAANAVFGDGLIDPRLSGQHTNGFVQRYKGKMRDLIKNPKLEKAFRQIVDSRESRSEDIISFFFGLETNKDFKTNASLRKMLAEDDELRFVFFVFYVAIVYHIAKLMLAKGLAMPVYLAFSGNGSRILDMLEEDDDTLASLAKLIIQKVYGRAEYATDGLKVRKESSKPKEITCKGALMLQDSEKRTLNAIGRNIDDIKAVWVGNGALVTAEKPLTYKDLPLNETDKIAKEATDFITFLYELDYAKKLGIAGKLPAYKPLLQDTANIKQAITKGKQLKLSEQNPDDAAPPIEETLFFYPLVDSLNRLAFKIHSDGN